MTNLKLINNKGFKWEHYGKNHFKGVVFLDGEYITNQDVNNNVDKLNNQDELITFVEKLDGNFCIVLAIHNETFVVVDKLRSIPLFYSLDGNNVTIYDSINESVIKKFGLSEESIDMFSSSTFVTGKSTLVNGIHQIPAGYILRVTNEKQPMLLNYWAFQYKYPQIDQQQDALLILEEAYKRTFQKTIEFLAGRMAVVPLSGGHDSRLIVYMLKKYGHKNIITFSYGDETNKDSIIAKQVAKALGVPFYFIKYSRKKLRSFFNDNLQSIMEYCGNAVSVTHVQDVFAINELFHAKVISNECVVVPGLGGILPGQYIQPDYLTKELYDFNDLIKRVIDYFFPNAVLYEKNFKNKFLFISEIFKQKGVEHQLTNTRMAELFEWFTFYEEQSKYILNSVRSYEYNNLEWATPLYSKELFNAWCSIDNNLRFNNGIYRVLEKKIISEDLLDIEFTGTKERKRSMILRGSVRKIRTALKLVLFPKKANYLTLSVPRKNYYFNILFRGRFQVTYYFMSEYVAWLKEITSRTIHR